VVLDPGNLVLSRVERVPGIGDNGRHFRRISDELIALLARCGVTGVEMRGISDLCLGDRKVGGASIRRADGLLYYATTLLVEPDLALVERLLPHPPREPDYRRGRPHRDFMGHIEAPGGGGMEALAERLRRDVELGGEEDACCRPGG
jgi:lipoate-protein ligase A